MILTVTLNAALDLTYQVPAWRPGGTHRVAGVAEHPGGKGVNAARVLHALYEPVIATGLVGGPTGAAIRELLDHTGASGGLRHSFVDIAEPSRRTVVIADGTDATGFWEPGPTVAPAEWRAFVRHYRSLLPVSRVAVLAGSLPPGLPDDAYAELVSAARAAEVPVLLDTSGEPLRAGLDAGPDLVKPNAHELAVATGYPVGAFGPGARELAATEGLAAAESLRGGRRTAVVASLGAAGLVASTVDGSWHAYLPDALSGNPTGAGDAAAAALARGLAYRHPWPLRLADAVGLAGAAVAVPVAGEVPAEEFQRHRRAAVVTRR